MPYQAQLHYLEEKEGGKFVISYATSERPEGLLRPYLSDEEKGRRLVSSAQAARFAKVFGHPPNVLVRLALQDMVRASGFKLKVSVEAA